MLQNVKVFFKKIIRVVTRVCCLQKEDVQKTTGQCQNREPNEPKERELR